MNVLDLLDPQYFNDIQVLVMQEAESLTEFLEIYETWDFLQFFKLSALKLAVKCNKVIKPQKVIVASKRK